MKLRTMAVLGGLGVAAIALIGAGGSALFTTSTTSTQQITAGTLALSLSGPSGSTCTTTGPDGSCTTLALPAYGPVGSSFDSGPDGITITNVGNIPANEITLSFSDSSNNSTLTSELWVCMTSGPSPLATPSGLVVVNEPLSYVELNSPQEIAGSIPAAGSTGDFDTYTTEFYAGPTQPQLCGATQAYLVNGPLPSSPTANPSADSLTNPAEGGVINISVTVGYSG